MVIWNLNTIFPIGEKNKQKKELKTRIDAFVQKKSFLTPHISSYEFNSLLSEIEQISALSSIINARFDLAFYEDTTDQQKRKDSQEIQLFLTDQSNKLIFFTHFFKDLDDENASRLIASAGRFRYYLKSLRKARPYMRSVEEEKIIILKDTAGQETLDTLRHILVGNLRFPFQGKKLLGEEIRQKVKSKDPNEREEAYNSFLTEYQKEEDLLGEIYKGLSLDWSRETEDIRGYKSAISARNFSNAISDDIIELMFSVIRKNSNLFQEYFSLKAKVLGYPNTRYHIYAPFVTTEKENYSYEQSKEITLNLFKNFSEEFFELAKKIFDSDHVHSDVLPGKQGGAFSYTYSKDATPFILLNHKDDYDSLSTMVHEFGHGIHGQLTKDKTEFTAHASLGLAETASIFSELLLFDSLKNSASVEGKKKLLFNHLDGVYASIIRQAYYALFEIKAHDKIKQGATVQDLHDIFYKLHLEQFGDVLFPKLFEKEWLSMPHIFEQQFYVYGYAFATLVVLSLYQVYKSSDSLNSKKDFVKKYTAILAAGGDADVVDILLNAGFDIRKESFWENAFQLIRADIEELKSLL